MQTAIIAAFELMVMNNRQCYIYNWYFVVHLDIVESGYSEPMHDGDIRLRRVAEYQHISTTDCKFVRNFCWLRKC